MIIIIPARGGSKRIKDKNIYPLCQKPLIQYTLEAIQNSHLNIPTYVTTDCEKIARVCNKFKYAKIINRPPEISKDNSSTESAILHAISYIGDKAKSHEWVMTLQPTSPFRSANTIKKFFNEANSCPTYFDSIMSVTKSNGDYWELDKNGEMKRIKPNQPRRQQDRAPIFEENSAIYITRIKALKETNFILGKKVKGITIPATEGFDINTPEDLELATLLKGSLK